jgi:hypothetical protein
MLENREIIDNLKRLDFEMLCAVADAIEDLGNEQGFDINLSKAIKERVDELLFAEKMVKAILCN